MTFYKGAKSKNLIKWLYIIRIDHLFFYFVICDILRKIDEGGGCTMALIKCPECGKEISDKATQCPNCGCPCEEFRKIKVPKELSENEKPQMFSCVNCGRPLPVGIEECIYCGYEYDSETKIKVYQDMKDTPKKKHGITGIIVWTLIMIVILIISVNSYNSYKISQENEENSAETIETENQSVGFEEENGIFESGKYLFITNEDLDKYCTNMNGVKVYVVTDIDDIKDGVIQSTLTDGFMMSSFNVGERFSKYESGLLEGDIIAICGTVSGQDDYGFVGNSVNLEDCYVFASGSEAEKYRKDKSDDALSQYFVVTEEVADSNDVSEEDYKSLCQQLNYEDILRNPDSYDGKYCIVSGTVDQVIEGWFGSFTIFVMDENGNKWGCTYSYDEGETHILEGDSVVMYGKCNGVENTETVIGEQVTLPHIDIEYWD